MSDKTRGTIYSEWWSSDEEESEKEDPRKGKKIHVNVVITISKIIITALTQKN